VLDDARFEVRAELGRGEAELADVDLVVVLAEKRRAAAEADRGTGEAIGSAGVMDGVVNSRTFAFPEEATVGPVWIVQVLFRAADDAPGEVKGLAAAVDLLSREALDEGTDGFGDVESGFGVGARVGEEELLPLGVVEVAGGIVFVHPVE
jgi:hypothetical protein